MRMKSYLLIFTCLIFVIGFVGTLSPLNAESLKEGANAFLAGNYQKAFKIFKPFAEQGNSKAQWVLGTMYEQGQGVPQDYTEAGKWFRKAADQGYYMAQYNLGSMYYFGEGVQQDYTKAAKWSRKAAVQGDASAQFLLGYMFNHGQGTPQDYVQAHKWYNLAASRSQGKLHKDSVNNRDFIEKSMTPDQIAEAKKLFREWKPKPAK